VGNGDNVRRRRAAEVGCCFESPHEAYPTTVGQPVL
jgi:hypothetical protein